MIGVLDGKKRAETQSKQKSTLFSRIFSRSSADKTRNVVAKANIEGEAAFYRQVFFCSADVLKLFIMLSWRKEFTHDTTDEVQLEILDLNAKTYRHGIYLFAPHFQGSLRIPQSINPQLVRYGSLRASHANNDHAKMNSAFDQYLKKNHTKYVLCVCCYFSP